MKQYLNVLVSLLLFSVLIVPFNASAQERPSTAPAGPAITWSSQSVVQSMVPGQSSKVTVSFQSASDLTDVSLRVRGRLANVISVEPTSFASVAANTPTEVTFTISVPQTWKGNLNGVIQLRSGKRGMGPPLHVHVTVERAKDAEKTKSGDADTKASSSSGRP